jgi:penicillin-binding protein 1C
VAAKTGTSKDFRDNWTVGYTPRFTVGVWVGNFDGTPMQNVSGMTGAGPLFRDIMLLLADGQKDGFIEPKNIVHAAICPLSGELPSAECPSTMDEIFICGTEPKTSCRLLHKKEMIVKAAVVRGPRVSRDEFMIAFPLDGDVFKLDPVLRRDYQTIQLKAAIADRIEVLAVEWWVNGQKVGSSGFPFTLAWNLAPGSNTIEARAVLKTGRLQSRRVKITVLS